MSAVESPRTTPLAQRIRSARLRAGLTQDQLAERLGTTRQVIIGWEKGRHIPTRKSRARIGVAVGRPDLFSDWDGVSG